MYRKCIYIFEDEMLDTDLILKNLKRYFDSVICLDFTTIKNDFENFKRRLVSSRCYECKVYFACGAFILNDNIYSFFDFCENSTGNTVVLNSKEQLIGDDTSFEYVPKDIVPFFVVYADKYIADIKESDFFSIGTLFDTVSFKAVSFMNELVKNNDKNNLPPIAFSNYEYIDSYGYPAFFLDAFRIVRLGMIRYGSDGGLRKLYDIFSATEGEKLLAEFILSRYDIAHIKDLLNLDISADVYETECKCDNVKYGAFVHLYYPDLFSEYAAYIEIMPDWIDIYISSDSNIKLEEIRNLLSERTISHTKLIEVNSRGRDVSALLVGMRAVVLQYDRILFIHDKKSHKDEFFTIGKAFNRDIWDNLVGDRDNICKIMRIFDLYDKIGLLTAPPPYYGIYAEVGSDFWTICYNKTKELLESFNLNVTPDKNTDPITLGMAFWCRTDALLPLFEHNWQYDDFQNEPMDIDGTISHAIERSLAYIAQSKGYFTAWVFRQENLSKYLQCSQYMLSRFKRKFNSEKASDKYVDYDMYDVLNNKVSLHFLPSEESFGVAKAFRNFICAFGVLYRSFLRKVKKSRLRKNGKKRS